MDTPDFRALGPLRLVARWLFDLALAPGRIAALAKTAEADRDPRPVCLACGKGRVAMTEQRTYPSSISTWYFGACTERGAYWELDPAKGIVGVGKRQS